ncbi:Calx-beta domain-containing protein, partial [Muriicola sp.]|uniref:Calx-beta domain-containing protein n=1 Tax=Muriicola sp. TaxID=2020856 RepID=UPI003C716220
MKRKDLINALGLFIGTLELKSLLFTGLLLLFGVFGYGQNITIDNVSQSEGTNLVFTVTLDASFGTDTTIDFTTNDGTATIGDSDYTGNTNQLIIPSLALSGTITIVTGADTKVESDETITVLLTGTNQGTITDNTGLGTILNDDNAVVTIANISGNENDGNITVTATLDNAVQGGFTVDVSTADGT